MHLWIFMGYLFFHLFHVGIFRFELVVAAFSSVSHLPLFTDVETSSNMTTIINGSDYYYDDYSVEEIGPDVLDDPGPIEEVLAGAQRKPQSPKRSFTTEEEMELLRLHNFYRGNVTPPAANMLFMEWDSELARIAQLWADKCKFKHGFPSNTYPGLMGQNLYRGPDGTGIRAVILWYEEYAFYDLKTGACEPKKQCGHYTQLAWANSKLVGCGIRKCGPDRHLIVCHYSPSGNVRNVAPYVVGRSCSQCDSVDGGLCTANLCVTHKQCEKYHVLCGLPHCPLKCHNCGALDVERCRCQCTPGWDSLDCSTQCRNDHEKCEKSPGWPSKTACSMNHFAVQDKYCRKMCDQCNGVDESEEVEGHSKVKHLEPRMLLKNGTCCAGHLCPEGHVLDLERRLCRCRLLCPGLLCHFSSVDEFTDVGKVNQMNCILLFMLSGLLLIASKLEAI